MKTLSRHEHGNPPTPPPRFPQQTTAERIADQLMDDTHHRSLTIRVGKGIVEWRRSLEEAQRNHDERAIELAKAVVAALQSCSTHCRRGLLESVTNTKPTEPAKVRPRPTVTVDDDD